MGDYNWLELILQKEAMTEKHKAIVRAAVELFSEKGYAACSTKEIAQRAEVAEALIFRHYPTKKDLMLRITERIIGAALFPLISSGLSELLSKSYKTREEFLSAFFQNRMTLIQDGLPLFKIIFQELPFQPEIRAMLIEQVKKMPLPGIAKKLNVGKELKLSGADVIQLLLTCLFGFFVLRNVMMPELFPEAGRLRKSASPPKAGRLQADAAMLVRFIDRGLTSEKSDFHKRKKGRLS